MKQLDGTTIHTVLSHLKPSSAKRKKLEASLSVLAQSIGQGAWIKRGSVKASAGFYQGIAKIPYRSGASRALFALCQCLQYGHALSAEHAREITDGDIATVAPKLPLHVAHAWIELCRQYHAAAKELDLARPLPEVTAIGLSPKVTETLTGVGLDLELSSIKPAKIERRIVPMMVFSTESGCYSRGLNKDGTPAFETIYVVVWSEGIKHRCSRFAHSGPQNCEACAKHIPSGRFVALEATCRRNGLVSLWVGRDCAASIFGVKDVGINRAVNTKHTSEV